MKNSFLESCINILKKQEIQHEIKVFLKPFLEMILIQLNPYIYISLFFVTISLLLLVGNFLLLLNVEKQLKLIKES
tara:strand:+ start:1442 stop:1669 length:228 start_codon:yes stop_codon:yes gene_type:complete